VGDRRRGRGRGRGRQDERQQRREEQRKQRREERLGQRTERQRAAERGLVDALGRLAQDRTAGTIDEAAYEARVRTLVEAAPDGVRRGALRIASALRGALRPRRSGDGGDDPGAG
jgi:hypothetical protein